MNPKIRTRSAGGVRDIPSRGLALVTVLWVLMLLALVAPAVPAPAVPAPAVPAPTVPAPAVPAPTVPAQPQGSRVVDLELALLVDVSASVSDEEFHLQVGGLATAFQSAAVLDAIRMSANRGIAVSVIQWANRANQRVSIEWTLLRGDADTLDLAAKIAAMPRLIHGGHTALGSALAFGLQELESNRAVGLRRVIDVSGDGRANDGLPLLAVREEVIEHGITINGLAILNELPLLDRYFRERLIGGDGAFVMVAQDYSDFAQAMAVKLVREIRAVPLSENVAPKFVHEARAKSQKSSRTTNRTTPIPHRHPPKAEKEMSAAG